MNPVTLRSSKRSRAAEVHCLSEKDGFKCGRQRRRNRINEKMKALQKLIPNSNKMDKASMLDEAIKHLKQLQLQVQIAPKGSRSLAYLFVDRPGYSQGNFLFERSLFGPSPLPPDKAAETSAAAVIESSSSFNFSDSGDYFSIEVKESSRKSFSTISSIDSDAITSMKSSDDSRERLEA
ncbi:unnamed protein product [Ilex paraguariensis]|uniref:BHLH domain-containing protein n=1 Tax=Ilex paraguariensis TaxID=185542 RepID=A0ABC8QYF4_9AQUA